MCFPRFHRNDVVSLHRLDEMVLSIFRTDAKRLWRCPVCEHTYIAFNFITYNVFIQGSGLAVLCSGVWMQVEMHKYVMLSGEYSDVAPYILVATGSLILLISSLACCCTVKGHPTLLYLVNWIKEIFA